MRPGDYMYNVQTGEVRLVIEVSQYRNEVTFSGSQRWEPATHWRSNVSLERRGLR